MKQLRRLSLSLLLFFCGFYSPAQTNVVSVDIFGLLLQDRKSISYERSFRSKFSVRLSYENQKYIKGAENGQTVYEVRGKGVIAEFRFYPSYSKKSAPLGFYLGSSFRNIGVTETYSPASMEFTGNVFNYTIISGYKFNFDRAIIEVLAGYGSGQVRGLDDPRRSQIAPFTDNTIDQLKANFRFEISLGFYFPKLSTD